MGPAIRIIGQHPEAQGSFAERIVVSEEFTRRVPEGVPNDAIAVVDAFAVGEFYVEKSKIGPGVIPIVLGAGAVGLSAVAVTRGPGGAPDNRFGSACRPPGAGPIVRSRRAGRREHHAVPL